MTKSVNKKYLFCCEGHSVFAWLLEIVGIYWKCPSFLSMYNINQKAILFSLEISFCALPLFTVLQNSDKIKHYTFKLSIVILLELYAQMSCYVLTPSLFTVIVPVFVYFSPVC